MSDDEKRYTLREAKLLLEQRACEREGHVVRGGLMGPWFRNSVERAESEYAGPDPVARGPLTCRCGAFVWAPAPSGDTTE